MPGYERGRRMTEIERSELKAEILKELEDSIKKKNVCKDTHENVLSGVRHKWFQDTVGISDQSIMYRKFGPVAYWDVWNMIRKLTCLICGVSYVRNLGKDKEFANYATEEMCKKVYELRIEFLERGKQ